MELELTAQPFASLPKVIRITLLPPRRLGFGISIGSQLRDAGLSVSDAHPSFVKGTISIALRLLGLYDAVLRCDSRGILVVLE